MEGRTSVRNERVDVGREDDGSVQGSNSGTTPLIDTPGSEEYLAVYSDLPSPPEKESGVTEDVKASLPNRKDNLAKKRRCSATYGYIPVTYVTNGLRDTAERNPLPVLFKKFFSVRWQATQHEKILRPENQFPCSFYGKQVADKYYLELKFIQGATQRSKAIIIHERTHTGDKPFPCDICGNRYIAKNILNTRKRLSHKKKQSKDLKITETLKRFFLDLCKMSSALTTDEAALLEPVVELNEEETEVPTSRRKLIQKSEVNSKVCAVCHKFFACPKRLERHQRMHELRKPFPCSVCGKGFFKTRDLKRHEVVHTGEKPFPCDVCGKRFPIASEVKAHQRVHSGEKPFVCGTCGQGFTWSKELKEHEYRHTGEKRFTCDYCQKGFLRLAHWRQHVRMHTGEKPFVCNICGKGFAGEAVLKRHVVTHEEKLPFACNICGKGFTRLCGLEGHQWVHTGEKSFRCPICQKTFSSAGTLKRHGKTHS
ncbi:unnamed protein product [Cyprideis torosa]|uniref:Uncharacterized protein n=1 Tax=Cyprideis torosa TaxID=163714 RepID=A0A7R8ZJ51_9CRUS|nr:unnamed protein product [Cyprideis torosa]CAG0887825.1 unnamed protein product [Cyprideis torosa]